MKQGKLFNNSIPASTRRKYLDSKEFREDLIAQNIQRGKLMALVVIAFETIFVAIDMVSFFLNVNQSFSFYSYLAMYLIMIAINILNLLMIKLYSQEKISIKAMKAILVVYLTVIMVWGSLISLMDQRLYGHIISFMINMMVCSIIFFADAKSMSIPYLCSVLALAIGLPFFQSSGDVLVGHYVNLAVFVAVSWIASRIIFRNYCDNFIIKALMNESNMMLAKEMEENRIINRELELANARLKELALVDELTGLPNRRSFREFIKEMFQDNRSDVVVSAIMVDIDNFKQYNDSYGHENGDCALIAVANQMKSVIKNSEQIAVRWGGEEFVFVAFNNSQEDIVNIANDIRLKVLELKIPAQGSSTNPYITVSMGTCTETINDIKYIRKIIRTADKALYLAKSKGKNAVETMSCDELDDYQV